MLTCRMAMDTGRIRTATDPMAMVPTEMALMLTFPTCTIRLGTGRMGMGRMKTDLMVTDLTETGQMATGPMVMEMGMGVTEVMEKDPMAMVATCTTANGIRMVLEEACRRSRILLRVLVASVQVRVVAVVN